MNTQQYNYISKMQQLENQDKIFKRNCSKNFLYELSSETDNKITTFFIKNKSSREKFEYLPFYRNKNLFFLKLCFTLRGIIGENNTFV